MDKKTIFWIVLFAVIALAAAGFLLLGGGGGSVAEVYLDGELIESIDLGAVREEYEIKIECDEGVNIIRVSPGAICVSYADCPDKICVDTGAISTGEKPIVCLPHRLVIQIREGGR